jgi:hypothetical protein
MAIEEKALVNVLDKLSGIRATMNKDERHALDVLVMRSRPGEGAAEVQAHALEVNKADLSAVEAGRFEAFALEAGSIRLKDDAYNLVETAR